MATIEIAGELRPLPPKLLKTGQVESFVKALGEKAGMEPQAARLYTESLIVSILSELGTRYVKAMREHFDAIVETRNQLKGNYRKVVRLGTRGVLKDVPEGLSAAEFNKLYRRLVDHMEAVQDFERFVKTRGKESSSLTELEAQRLAAEEAKADDQPTGTRPTIRLNRRGSAPGEPPPKISAADQERLDYLADLRDVGEDGAARLRAMRTAERFRLKFLGDRYRVTVRRTPGFGASRAQIEGLRSFDSDLGGAGFEMVITGHGRPVAPDGLELTDQGERFRFLEWKEPAGEKGAGYYWSREGRLELRRVMIERAKLAADIPGCDGWWYESGKQWMNTLVADIVGTDPEPIEPLKPGETAPPPDPNRIRSIADDPDPSVAALAKWIKFPPRGTVVKR